MKQCTKCERSLSEECFAALKRSRDGLYPSCKECESATRKAFRDTNKERLSEAQRDNYKRNADARRTKQNAYYRANKSTVNLRQRERYATDEEYRADRVARSKDAYMRDPETMRTKGREQYYKNREKRIKMALTYQAERIARDPEYLEKLKAWRADYRKRNMGRYAQHAMKRYAARKQAVPGWFDPIQARMFYDLAAELTATSGVPYHVDHIVPIQSDIVCGLHWHGNFQVIVGTENISKGNRVWPDMP